MARLIAPSRRTRLCVTDVAVISRVTFRMKRHPVPWGQFASKLERRGPEEFLLVDGCLGDPTRVHHRDEHEFETGNGSDGH